MKIGLYHLKYPLRRMIEFVLPLFRSVNPNVVSISLIPLGLLTAGVYFFAPQRPSLYLIGAALILLRMVVGTLDGLIAQAFSKSSPKGEMINRIAPEVCDIALMLAIVFSSPKYLGVGCVAIALCWAVTFFGLIGVVANRPIQSVGPVGQTDRIAALALLSVLQLIFGFDGIQLFLWWTIFGSLITLALRIYPNFKRG